MSEQLPVLTALGAELERAMAREARRGHVRRRRSLAGLATLAAVSLSAGAIAASGILTGTPVKDPPGPRPVATAGAGVIVAGSAQLSTLRTADPGGGPPWGLRTLRTTRQLGCVQLGRVVGGQLGVLGRDGAFANDGLFHPLGPDVVGQRQCELLDGAGQTFLAISYSGLPASAQDGGCAARRFHLPKGFRAPPKQPRLCPPADERLVYYGLLGPDAVSVGYRDATGSASTRRRRARAPASTASPTATATSAASARRARSAGRGAARRSATWRRPRRGSRPPTS